MDLASEHEGGIDAHVLSAEVPLLKNLVSVTSTGQSAWATAYRVNVLCEDSEDEESYFMKVSVGEHGKQALHGEYESSLAIYNVTPDFAPKPLGWGSFKAIEDTHYYLCKFHELNSGLPPKVKFTEQLTKLHTNAKSPNGKFGFHITTYNGDLPQDNTWADSWLEFFINGFEHILKINVERGGPWEEMEKLKPDMISKVIPRLLKPMETKRHTVEPVLVHGDLWCGNAAVDVESNQPLIYDPSSFYAHNEYELGNWRPERNRFSGDYFIQYHAKIPKSYPEDDYDDRNALYAMRFNLHAAAIFPGKKIFRKLAEDEMRRLVAKFPYGYEDFIMPTVKEDIKKSPAVTRLVTRLISGKGMYIRQAIASKNNLANTSASTSNTDQIKDSKNVNIDEETG